MAFVLPSIALAKLGQCPLTSLMFGPPGDPVDMVVAASGIISAPVLYNVGTLLCAGHTIGITADKQIMSLNYLQF